MNYFIVIALKVLFASQRLLVTTEPRPFACSGAKIYVEVDNTTRVIGEDPSEPVARAAGACFTRMAGWVVSAAKTLQAEFPAFEGTMSFGCFRLQPRASMQPVTANMERLTQIFGGDAEELKQDCN